MYQQLTLVGNLGHDPEMRYTPNGTPVTSFSLAVNRSWTDHNGDRQERTTWFRISIWNKQAEVCAQYLTKGRQVLVIGEVNEARPWIDQEGNARAGIAFLVDPGTGFVDFTDDQNLAAFGQILGADFGLFVPDGDAEPGGALLAIAIVIGPASVDRQAE